MRRTLNQNANLIVLAYIIPFLCVVGALWSAAESRDNHREAVSEVFSEGRDALLLVCEDVENVKNQVRISIRESKAENLKQLANFENNPEIRRILEKGIENSDVLLKRFAAKNCEKYPFIRREEFSDE